jgi:DNA (cytosine-5)-methyltransferase 1
VYHCPVCITLEVQPYYYCAANAIDWSLTTTRIGDREKPLKSRTIERIQIGLQKFAGQKQPFITQVNKTTHRVYGTLDGTMPTQTCDNGAALVYPPLPFLLNLEHSQPQPSGAFDMPMPTRTTYDSTSLVVPPPFLMDHVDEYRPRAITDPVSTIVAGGNHQSLITPPVRHWLMTYYGNGGFAPDHESVQTATTVERHALVQTPTATSEVAVEECGFRMLDPEEIKAAMAFPSEYVIVGNRRQKVRQLGNACTPPVIKKLMERVMAVL